MLTGPSFTEGNQEEPCAGTSSSLQFAVLPCNWSLSEGAGLQAGYFSFVSELCHASCVWPHPDDAQIQNASSTTHFLTLNLILNHFLKC